MAVGLGQTKSNNVLGSATSIDTGAFASQPTAGSCITVFVTGTAASNPTATVTDSAGNTYTQRRNLFSGDFVFLKTFTATNITTGASFTVTADFGATSCTDRRIMAVEGTGTTTLVDDTGASFTAPGTATDVLTGDLATGLGSFVVGACRKTSPGTTTTISPGTGMTDIAEVADGEQPFHMEYFVGTTSVETIKFSWNVDGNALVQGASFNPAGGAPAPALPFPAPVNPFPRIVEWVPSGMAPGFRT